MSHTTQANGGGPTTNVPVGQCSDGSWCCGGVNATCCKDKVGVMLAATVGVSSTPSTSSSITTSHMLPTESPAAPVTSSTSNLSGTNNASSITPSSTNTNTDIPSSTASSEGLNSGAKIGVGVGVAGGVIAIISISGAFFALKRRRASRKMHGTVQTFVPYYEGRRAELPDGHANFELPA